MLLMFSACFDFLFSSVEETVLSAITTLMYLVTVESKSGRESCRRDSAASNHNTDVSRHSEI